MRTIHVVTAALALAFEANRSAEARDAAADAMKQEAKDESKGE